MPEDDAPPPRRFRLAGGARLLRRGVTYLSRHYHSGKALCLFGDRLEPGSLRVDVTHPDTRVFALPQDAEWFAALAAAIHVTTRP